MRKSLALIGAVALSMFMATIAHTALIASHTGNLTADDNVLLFNFTVGGAQPQQTTLRSWSYAGGVNAVGSVIPAGGFDIILALFDSSGVLIGENDDGGCGVVHADPQTRACFDSFLRRTLTPGNYTVSVAEYDNFANGPNLSNGFRRNGQGNFTTGFECPDNQPAFNDVTGVAGCGRTSFFAFDIAVVPEPGSLVLLGGALTMLGVWWRRRA